jgi:hypothetical protein
LDDVAGEHLSDDELRTMTRLLARFCAHDLDQSEDWRLETPHGTVYVSVTRGLPPGVSQDAFTRIWPLPPKLADQTDTATG